MANLSVKLIAGQVDTLVYKVKTDVAERSVMFGFGADDSLVSMEIVKNSGDGQFDSTGEQLEDVFGEDAVDQLWRWTFNCM